jgi:hypothetical protein
VQVDERVVERETNGTGDRPLAHEIERERNERGQRYEEIIPPRGGHGAEGRRE